MNKKIVIAMVSFAAFALVVGGIGFVQAQSNSTQPGTGSEAGTYYGCRGLQSGNMRYGAHMWGNLTQAQRDEIVATAESMQAAGATHAEIHDAIIAKLQGWGIDTSSYPSGSGMMGNGVAGSGAGMMGGYTGGMMGGRYTRPSNQTSGNQRRGVGPGCGG
jgi:hypothetical protein